MITVNLRAKTYLSTEVIHLYRVKNLSRKHYHLHYPQFMDDSDREQRELGLFFALVLLGKCDELWVFDKPSEGMAREIAKAKKRGMPIKYYNHKCEVLEYGI